MDSGSDPPLKKLEKLRCHDRLIRDHAQVDLERYFANELDPQAQAVKVKNRLCECLLMIVRHYHRHLNWPSQYS